MAQGLHEEPQLNFGWRCAVNTLLARNCLLMQRREPCTIPETPSLGAPDAGVVDNRFEPLLNPYPFGWPRSHSVSFLLQYYHSHLVQCDIMPKALFQCSFLIHSQTLCWCSDSLRQVQRSGALYINSYLSAMCPQALRGFQPLPHLTYR